MRFLPNGPDIPADLIAAQERGDTLFICGAGVSRTVGLPLFRGLVESVYRALGEDWNLHAAERYSMQRMEYDRVLRSLERRLVASGLPGARGMRRRIRAAVRDGLAPPGDADLVNHLALLRLSRDDEGQSRLLTTNFDTLFERAWWEAHQEAIASHGRPTSLHRTVSPGVEGSSRVPNRRCSGSALRPRFSTSGAFPVPWVRGERLFQSSGVGGIREPGASSGPRQAWRIVHEAGGQRFGGRLSSRDHS
jgi:hypothetical protein